MYKLSEQPNSLKFKWGQMTDNVVISEVDDLMDVVLSEPKKKEFVMWT